MCTIRHSSRACEANGQPGPEHFLFSPSSDRVRRKRRRTSINYIYYAGESRGGRGRRSKIEPTDDLTGVAVSFSSGAGGAGFPEICAAYKYLGRPLSRIPVTYSRRRRRRRIYHTGRGEGLRRHKKGFIFLYTRRVVYVHTHARTLVFKYTDRPEHDPVLAAERIKGIKILRRRCTYAYEHIYL